MLSLSTVSYFQLAVAQKQLLSDVGRKKIHHLLADLETKNFSDRKLAHLASRNALIAVTVFHKHFFIFFNLSNSLQPDCLYYFVEHKVRGGREGRVQTTVTVTVQCTQCTYIRIRHLQY